MPAPAARHPIHLSLTELRWNDADKTLEISHKFFLDDLEAAMRADGIRTPLYLGQAKETPAADSLLRVYLNRHRKLVLDACPVSPAWVGREADLEAMYLYEEVKLPAPPTTVQLQLTALLDLYDDQKAIVNWYVPGRSTRSALLTQRNRQVRWD